MIAWFMSWDEVELELSFMELDSRLVEISWNSFGFVTEITVLK